MNFRRNVHGAFQANVPFRIQHADEYTTMRLQRRPAVAASNTEGVLDFGQLLYEDEDEAEEEGATTQGKSAEKGKRDAVEEPVAGRMMDVDELEEEEVVVVRARPSGADASKASAKSKGKSKAVSSEDAEEVVDEDVDETMGDGGRGDGEDDGEGEGDEQAKAGDIFGEDNVEGEGMKCR